MSANHDDLRSMAQSIVRIPEHYVLVMEDSVPKGGEQERCFVWEDPEHPDHNIEIALDLTSGLLTRLEINLEHAEDAEPHQLSDVEEARRAADAFVAKHAPQEAEYTSVSMMERGGEWKFIYREEAGGLPLPGTGCELKLDRELNVVRFRQSRRGIKPIRKPILPVAIADTNTVIASIRRQLRMEPAIVSLHPSIYEIDGSEPEYRLVYEPVPDRPWIDAVTGVNRFEPEHYTMPPSFPLPRTDSAPIAACDETLSWEKKLGIDLEQYVCEQSADDGERMKVLYQPKEQEETLPQSDPLSADAYLERRWGGKLRAFRDSAIMVQIEKATGRLVGFHRMGHAVDGQPVLSREQCWVKAEQFLRSVFPDYAVYLQLEADKAQSDATDEEPRDREFFYLPVYMNGIPVNHERVTISISTINGDVCTYMGVSYAMIQQLSERSFTPAISPEAAHERYTQPMQLRLQWFLDDDQEPPAYQLLYIPTFASDQEPDRERTLRYIDAVTGELIWEK